MPSERQGAETRRRAPQELLESDVAVRELQRLDEIVFMRVAIHAEEANRCCNRRLRGSQSAPLQRRQRFERALVADSSQRDSRIVLQRTFELRNGVDRIEGVVSFVIAQRLDDRASKEILA